LAIILLSSVSVLGRLPQLLHYTPPLLTEIDLIFFVGSSYALLRFRASLIPLRRVWHIAAVTAMVVALAVYFLARFLGAVAGVSTGLQSGAALLILLVWGATVIEPCVRFWMVARGLPAVQAWRLRSLSLGFAGIVAILLFAVLALGAGAATSANQAVQLIVQLVVLAVVPLLYVSFSPPSWLRREWRASEEEGLRAFMEELLLSEDQDALANRALEWAMRLVGGAAAASFDTTGTLRSSRGFPPDQLIDLKEGVGHLGEGVGRMNITGSDHAVLMLPIKGLAGAGALIVVSGPFTPAFGSDEMRRVQQFMSAFATALDRRQLMVRLEESNLQLQAANRHKSVFLASMSHELRTPLNAILGFSELLIDANNGQFSPATRKRFLEQIHSSGKHLLGLINDILDLSKIEAGQMELRLQTVNIEEVVNQVAATVEPLASQKKIQFKIADGGAGDITADAGKVRQMLLNLASNAVKFTPEGGMVTIATRRLPESIEVSFADTGIGIDKQDQERIFHEFQQVDSGVGRSQPGTGLGLTLTRRFARLHGGDVNLQSEPGKGSVFTIGLPIQAHSEEPLAARPTTVRPSDASRPLVLVVEDDPAAAELLTRQLDRAGFGTVVARSGADAIAKAIAIKPAAITLDILLPDLDGWEVLTRLKRESATSEIPVVVVSVVDNPELGMALGALDYFVKPVPANDLINRLNRFKFVRKGGEKPRVLVVDDEPANREWLKRILEPAGFAVIEARGGKEAIELAKSRKPDLVLLDLMMPEVTGFDVVEALRADESTKSTPIMVLTAKHLTEADIRQLNGHVSTILKRGSTGATDLLQLLRQAIDTTSPAK
jgi:signal transduction histidine kinase/CheY-like chemotaxis protein